MKESLLFVTEPAQGSHRTLCLLPIVHGKEKNKQIYGLQMERINDDCAFRLIRLEDVKTEGARSLTEGPVAGCLGILRLEGGEDWVAVITKCTLCADMDSARRIYRIDRVDFYSISSSRFDQVDASIGTSEDSSPAQFIHPAAEITSYMSSGYFFFSYDHDLTQSVQNESKDTVHSWRTCSDTFFWNSFLLEPVREFAEGLPMEHLKFIEHGGLFVVAMQGFVQSSTIPFLAPSSESLRLVVISRLSCNRAGTRFRARGIDDDGNVANHVESEVLISHDNALFSYLILRGSTPAFWDQQGLQFGRPSFQMTRNAAATQPAHDRHFDKLTRQYGLVHCIDLLGQKTGSAEQLLSAAYKLHLEKYPGFPETVTLTQFDVNAVCKGEDLDKVEAILQYIGPDIQLFGYSHIIDTSSARSTVEREQRGAFRINCQDCLDRTNLVQGFVVRVIVDLYLRNHLQPHQLHIGTVLTILSNIWANNGDALSMIYTGTGALRSGYTRSGKRTLAGLMDDVRKTAQRFYVNNFQDKYRQQAVDMLLGKKQSQNRVSVFNPIAKAVFNELSERAGEYSQLEDMKIMVVTWNCSGAISGDLSNLFRPLEGVSVIAVSFQEIVELSATQIMSVDPERRLAWEKYIQSLLGEDYSLLVSNQLVGTTLSVFAKSPLLNSIRAVEIGTIKTGFGGMTGNKGSVGIRMDLKDTALCFIASHFTAGQAYADERNKEWRYVLNGLQFTRNRMIASHDVVVWMGDLNYRVDMNSEDTRALIEEENWEKLLSADQLTNAIEMKYIPEGFKEGLITFAPTYKYDKYTNDYDTSEKNRTPSYTDRILINALDDYSILQYSRDSTLMVSDHRPVYALFQVKIKTVDKTAMEWLQAELFSKYISLPSLPPRTNMLAPAAEVSEDVKDFVSPLSHEVLIDDFDEPTRKVQQSGTIAQSSIQSIHQISAEQGFMTDDPFTYEHATAASRVVFDADNNDPSLEQELGNMTLKERMERLSTSSKSSVKTALTLSTSKVRDKINAANQKPSKPLSPRQSPTKSPKPVLHPVTLPTCPDCLKEDCVC